jgi:hypothetical protein
VFGIHAQTIRLECARKILVLIKSSSSKNLKKLPLELNILETVKISLLISGLENTNSNNINLMNEKSCKVLN